MATSDDDTATFFSAPLTRRRLLRRAAGSGAALGLLGAGGLAGTAEAAEEATPRVGGTLRLSLSGQPDNLGTATWGAYGWALGYAQFNRLTNLTKDGKGVVPELATKIDVGRGGRSYTFHLRRGVLFSDGTEMTADDVKFSLERQLDPKSGTQAQSLFGGLGITGAGPLVAGKAKTAPGIHVVDSHTVRIDLDAPNSSVPYVLSMTMAGIVPKAYVQKIGSKEFEQKPIGTGPYRISKQAPGQYVLFERNPHYYDRATRGYVDAIDWRFNVDPNLAILRIERGELDLMADAVPTGQLNALRGNAAQRSNLLVGLINQVTYVGLSTKHPALKKLEVRKAVALAMNRAKTLRLLGGVGAVANGGLFSPLSPYYRSRLGYAYDPQRAKALLKAAGFAGGFPLTVLSDTQDPKKTAAAGVANDLQAVGIDAHLKQLPTAAFISAVIPKPPSDAIVGVWELPYPHGSYIVDSAFTKSSIASGCCNFAQWWAPRFEQLVSRAHSAATPARLEALYRTMDRIAVRDEVLWVPLVYNGYAALKSKRLQGYSIPGTPAGDALFFNRYWLA